MINLDSKSSVLIVDDMPENIQILSSILYQKGISIAVAQNGRDALSIAAQRPPDLILLDIIMPGMDGFEVCEHLKKDPATRDIPIIFLTAKKQPEYIIKGFDLGAVDYVTRPFNPSELVSRVFTHLELKKSRDLITTQNQQLAEQHKELQELYTLKEQYFSDTLRESEERFRSTFEQAAVGIAHVAPDGHFLRLNQRFCEIVGYTQEEMLKQTFQDITHPDDLDTDLTYVRQVLKGRLQTYSTEKRYIRKNGSLVWVNLTVSLVRGASDEPKYFISVVEDITRRKQAEQALRTSEQQYRLLAEHVADGIGIIREEKLVFVNEALSAMLGYTAGQLTGKAPLDLFHDIPGEPLEKTNKQAEQGRSDPQNWPVIQHVITGDGRKIWIEGRYSTIMWEGKSATLMTIRDITKRKLREIAIEEERNDLRRENVQLRATIKERYRFGEIIGKSQAMQEVYEMVLKAAAYEKDVLICGESGTGKELIARTIHQLSKRQGQAFVPVNCGAIPESLFEREFFGHRKGAFTGADRDKRGFFAAAREGTLFLDEVGELSLSMQVKLLRALESREYTPLGDNKPRTSNVRIIAATNRNLTEQVEKGKMREDFFYRIHVIKITVPPLRDRQEDIPLLVDHFLKQSAESETPPILPGRVLEALYNHHWPGNIRQLQNTISRYLTTGRLDFIAPRSAESIDNADAPEINLPQQGLTLTEAVEQFEKRLILRTLEQHRWHRTNAAATLGIQRKSLFRKMKKYGL